MNKLRVIDLLNMISKGEEVPKKIKIKQWENNAEDEDLEYELFDRLYNEDFELNDEVEIIEQQEDNFTGWKMYKNGKQVCSIEDETLETQTTRIKLDKIEELENYISCGWNGTCKDLKRESLFEDLQKIGNKINEIIDKINEEN